MEISGCWMGRDGKLGKGVEGTMWVSVSMRADGRRKMFLLITADS